MVDINQVRFFETYREHRKKALAGLKQVRDKKRRRALVVLPIGIAAGVVVAYNAVYAESGWAIAVVGFLHSLYFLPILFIAGMTVISVQAAKVIKSSLRLQFQLSSLLVATNMSTINEHREGRTPPPEIS